MKHELNICYQHRAKIAIFLYVKKNYDEVRKARKTKVKKNNNKKNRASG